MRYSVTLCRRDLLLAAPVRNHRRSKSKSRSAGSVATALECLCMSLASLAYGAWRLSDLSESLQMICRCLQYTQDVSGKSRVELDTIEAGWESGGNSFLSTEEPIFVFCGSLLWLNFGSLVNSCCPQLSDRIEVGFSFAWCCVAVLLYSMLAPPGRRCQCSRGGSNMSVYVKSQERLDTGHTGLSWTDCRLWGTYFQ